MEIGVPRPRHPSGSPPGWNLERSFIRNQSLLSTMIHHCNSTDWAVRPLSPASRGKQRRAVAPPSVNVPGQFLPPGATVAGEFAAQPQPAVARRGGLAPALDFEADCAPGECAVVLVRHPSGALTFHASVGRTAARRGANAAPERARFVIPQRPSPVTPDGQPARRGFVSQAIHFAVVKIKEAVVDQVVSAGSGLAIQGLEWGWWKVRGMDEGWCHVTPETLRAGKLREIAAADLRGSGRALLLIHGTFSHAASAFKGLASGDFFPQARALYGDRIFAFNHFTLSRSPEENVAALLKSLPANGLEFDVVTHSRGGLVLRHIIERPDLFGAAARRFQLGQAVLVASPNAGTPWVTPGRWEDTVGLVGNLLEAFPVDNPWTDGAAFVANGITWLAGHLAADWPGLASMDGRGEGIARLQESPGPAAGAYSALVANSHPAGNLLARLVGAGVDSFFSGANDFVVPSEGGWRVDAAEELAIPGERVGCFGPGGNLTAGSGDLVQHINFFSQRETADFLLRALRREPQSLGVLELTVSLPTRKLFRGGPPAAAAEKTPVKSPSPRRWLPRSLRAKPPSGTKIPTRKKAR